MTQPVDTTMTAMSVIGRAVAHNARVNVARSCARDRLARALHGGAVVQAVCAALPFLVACVIPPSLSLDQPDAAPDSPPTVISVRGTDGQELAYPGPVAFANGSGSINLTLLDTDITDTLYVRIFVNYGDPDPTPARATCEAASGEVQRVTTCDLAGLCTSDIDGTSKTNYMTIVVFDRQPLDSGTPLYQAIPPDGLSTTRPYFLTCEAP